MGIDEVGLRLVNLGFDADEIVLLGTVAMIQVIKFTAVSQHCCCLGRNGIVERHSLIIALVSILLFVGPSSKCCLLEYSASAYNDGPRRGVRVCCHRISYVFIPVSLQARKDCLNKGAAAKHVVYRTW